MAVTSDRSPLALILFDEIEKAAPSMTRLLLGILDRGTLRLGDGSSVSFEHTLVFLTSNLGARAMASALNPAFGFQAGGQSAIADASRKLERIATNAVRKRFSPEFVNRIDSVITYRPLAAEDFSRILDLEMRKICDLVDTRLGAHRFHIEATKAARALLVGKGSSAEYGARELKRTLHRSVIQPTAQLVTNGRVPPGATVRVDAVGPELKLRVIRPRVSLRPAC
jgi:ATP-dependent Clp protease ATP-binding subunit ClpA